MSTRGELTLECDVPDCYAEHRYSADDLESRHLSALNAEHGWVVTAEGKDVCPACREEGKGDAPAW